MSELTLTQIESDTEKGTYVETYATYKIDGIITNYLLLRTEFFPNTPKTTTYTNDEPDTKLGEFWN